MNRAPRHRRTYRLLTGSSSIREWGCDESHLGGGGLTPGNLGKSRSHAQCDDCRGSDHIDHAMAAAVLAGLPPFAPLAFAALRLASVLALPPFLPNCAIQRRFP